MFYADVLELHAAVAQQKPYGLSQAHHVEVHQLVARHLRQSGRHDTLNFADLPYYHWTALRPSSVRRVELTGGQSRSR